MTSVVITWHGREPDLIVTTTPPNRVADKDDPKCQDCQKRFCTYNQWQCLKCHNKDGQICQGCQTRKFVYSDDRCFECRRESKVIQL